jgi:hypothetical protein
MILIVSYELKQSTESYLELFETLKGQTGWAHYMDSTWLIDTEKSPKELSQELIPHIYKDDRFLVTELVRGYQGWLPSKAWDWIKRHRDLLGSPSAIE